MSYRSHRIRHLATKFGALTLLFFVPFVAAAQTSNPGYPTGGSQAFALQNPLGATTSLCGLIKNLLNGILTLGAPVAMLFLVYSGFMFIWARGNPGELTKARSNLVHTLIGIAIFLGAWTLGQMIAGTINQLQSGAGASFTSCS